MCFVLSAKEKGGTQRGGPSLIWGQYLFLKATFRVTNRASSFFNDSYVFYHHKSTEVPDLRQFAKSNTLLAYLLRSRPFQYYHYPHDTMQGCRCLIRRLNSLTFSFSTSSSSKSTKQTPSTWERSAKLVKNTDVTNPYLEQVRTEVVDPALQLKTIEDELCGAIGKALGRQGEKVLNAMRLMNQQYTQYQECINTQSYDEAIQAAERYNEARRKALTARWELLVHRQAVGFTVDNHSVVHSTFPIGEALPVTMNALNVSLGMNSTNSNHGGSNDTKRQPSDASDEKKKYGDQLKWWQTVGRWR